jgi:CheY-like chemotaxis protein
MKDGKPTIIIVDDEPFNLEIIMEYLSEFDFDVRTAEDGLDAWTQLEAEPEVFDLVLLDRMMPNMDGMEVLSRIKSHPILMQIPVILQTAMASKQDVTDGLKAGAYYYLTKPFEEEMLRSVVATAIDDHMRYLSMQQQIETTSKMTALMKSGEFAFRDLDQARGLATLLSNLCPEPQKVVVGMSELLINAVEHGNLGITYKEKGQLKDSGTWLDEVNKRLEMPEYSKREVLVNIERLDDSIVFTIRDEGAGFDFSNYLEMDPERAFDNHGRGIAMSRMLSFDSLDYLGNGNEVRAVVKLNS